jgi:hypothetical protein
MQEWADADATSRYEWGCGVDPDGSTSQADIVIERMRSGFPLDALTEANAVPAAIQGLKSQPRMTEDTEGEYQHDLYESGETEYYIERLPSPALIGVKVEASMSMSSGTPNHAVAAYGEWIGQLIKALKTQGFDVGLTTFSRSRDLYKDERYSENHMEVIEPGQTSIERDWSGLFAPSGYRHLNFWMKMARNRAENTRINDALGYPEGAAWGIEFHPDTRTLRVTNPSTFRTFPAEQLTAEVKELWLDLIG